MAIKAGWSERPSSISRYNAEVTWIYLSPHFDDVALSCGGLVWEQTNTGELVLILTVCAGGPPPGEISPFARELHNRWQSGQNAPAERMVEDENSCRRLGAGFKYFTLPDCIYRRHPQTGEVMYASEASLNGPLHSGDTQVIDHLSAGLQRAVPQGATVVCPLALGNHVDHQLTRLAAQALGGSLWYYADFPYVLGSVDQLEHKQMEGWKDHVFAISPEGLEAWQDSISAHASQISTFWPSDLEMRRVVSEYLYKNGGIHLWRKPAA